MKAVFHQHCTLTGRDPKLHWPQNPFKIPFRNHFMSFFNNILQIKENLYQDRTHLSTQIQLNLTIVWAVLLRLTFQNSTDWWRPHLHCWGSRPSTSRSLFFLIHLSLLSGCVPGEGVIANYRPKSNRLCLSQVLEKELPGSHVTSSNAIHFLRTESQVLELIKAEKQRFQAVSSAFCVHSK